MEGKVNMELFVKWKFLKEYLRYALDKLAKYTELKNNEEIEFYNYVIQKTLDEMETLVK